MKHPSLTWVLIFIHYIQMMTKTKHLHNKKNIIIQLAKIIKRIEKVCK